MKTASCARVIAKRIAGLRITERNFSLPGTLHNIEARFIEKALDETGGSITRAAKLLGILRQSLANLLKTRHRRLMVKRTPAKRRRRSIIQKAKE